MGTTIVPSVVTGQTYSAAAYNTNIKDNINAFLVFTTAGDIVYATSANTLTRLGLTVGGILYGGASAPAWLAKPSVDSLLKNTSAGTPSWLALTSISSLHAIGSINWLASDQTEAAGTWTDVTNATLNLTTTQSCTIIMIAIAMTYVNNASYGCQLRCSIDGTVDPSTVLPWSSVANVNVSQTTFYVRTGVASGTKTCKLQFHITSAGATAHIDRGSILAFAFN